MRHARREGSAIDHGSDIHSLAKMVWELTTGTVMYSPELSEYEVLMQIVQPDHGHQRR